MDRRLGASFFGSTGPPSLVDLVDEWKAMQVVAWIKGLPAPANAYSSVFGAVNGLQLLNLDADDLFDMGVTCRISCSIIRRAAALLAHVCYYTESENLQSLFLALGVLSYNAARECEARVHSELNDTVSRVTRAANIIMSWLERRPFNEVNDYKSVNKWLWSETCSIVQLANGSKHEMAKNATEIAKTCYSLSDVCNDIVQKWKDPMVLCTSFIDQITLYMKAPAREWGFDLHEDVTGLMMISAIEYNSVADRCDKMHIGDEILAIDGQIVIGWDKRELGKLLNRRHTSQVSLLLKRRPCDARDNSHMKSQPPSPRRDRREDSLPIPSPSALAKQRHLSTSQGNMQLISTRQHAAIADIQALLDGTNRKKLTRRVSVCLGSPRSTRRCREMDNFYKRRTHIPQSLYDNKLRKLRAEAVISTSSTGGSSSTSLVFNVDHMAPVLSCTSTDDDDDDDDVFANEPHSPVYGNVLETDVEYSTVESADVQVDRPDEPDWNAHNISDTCHSLITDESGLTETPLDASWLSVGSSPIKRNARIDTSDDISSVVLASLDDSFSAFGSLTPETRAKLQKFFGASPATPIIASNSSDADMKASSLSPSFSPPVKFQINPSTMVQQNRVVRKDAASKASEQLLQELCTTPCSDLKQAYYKGYLYRCRLSNEKGRDKWIRRFCVLHEATLFIYKSEQDFMAEAVFYVPFFTVSPCEPEYRTRKKDVFKITNNHFTLYLYHNSKDTCHRWMNQLGLAAIKQIKKLNLDPNSPGYYLSCAQSIYATLPRGRPQQILTHLRKSLRNAGHSSGSRPRLSRESSTGSTASANSTDKVIDPLRRPKHTIHAHKRRPNLNIK